MSYRVLAVLFILLLTCPIARAYAQTASSAAAQVWSSPAPLESKLAPEVVLDGFAFRSPVGFLYKKMGQADPGTTVWVFENLDHFPGVATDLYVATCNPSGTMLWSADRAVPGMIQSIVQKLTNTKVIPIERGYIDNLPALRCYIKGDLKLNPQMAARTGRTSLEKHLFVYVFGTEKSGFTFVGEDIAPFNAETMPLLEASVLTTHRTNSP